MGYKGTIKVYAEECCDLCNDIIHNHLDCPVCRKEWAGSEEYHDLYGWDDPDPAKLECACGAIFRTTDNPYDPEAIWVQDEADSSSESDSHSDSGKGE